MIHRAPFGSMERFMGILIEHFGGAFPLWLAPVQAAVLSISEKHNDYAKEVQQALQNAGMRVEADLGPEKIGAKIRNALMAKTPLLLVLGEKEQTDRTVSVRPYFDVDDAIKGTLDLQEFINQAEEKIAQRWHPVEKPAGAAEREPLA
jgi:threonyl-tRNA synthetase